MSNIKEVEVKLTIEEDNKENLEKQTQLLMTELKELDAVKKAEPSKTGTVPDNARAGEVIAWGQILITFMTSGGLVAAIGALNSWIKGRKKQLKIEKNGETKTIDASGLNDDEMNKILEWLKQ